jgi:hypothetical protein
MFPGAHCVDPGTHSPVHVPALHRKVQDVELLTNVPAGPQVCTTKPLHCFCPGAHEPAHAPATHVLLTHGVSLPNAPLAVQVWTPLLKLHCV